jgi:hypothetical protein
MPPTHSGTRQPDQSKLFCFSTTFESLTRDIIEKELQDLGKYILDIHNTMHAQQSLCLHNICDALYFEPCAEREMKMQLSTFQTFLSKAKKITVEYPTLSPSP